MKKSITHGTELEKRIGYSRARRIGNAIAVTGTAPIAEDGGVHAPGDMYEQARRSLEIIREVLELAGASLEDVIRTRVFVTDMTRWEEAARAHGEFFGDIQPACTFAEVSRFIHPEWLVEIEANAIVEEQNS
ncbi:RidA family protein [Salidesulfovibrio onnuriiensis]|uniref:RidA family protein n=1 Tax=Salidesulfovibrio onnuriiensis TaxID=2583823 RepID=UPI0011C7DCA9|nr:RidA family protein [Salidesulfovibrio onnuriiensis]